MNYLIRLLILLVTILTIMNGCSEKKLSNTVIISLHAPEKSDSTFTVKSINVLNYEGIFLKEGKLDAMGKGVVEFSISKPIFASLQIGDKFHKIYLEPSYQLNASFIAEDLKPEVHYSGIGSKVNNYLAHTSLMLENFHNKHGAYWRLDPERFANIIDTLSQSLKAFHTSYTDSLELADNMQQLINAHNEINIISLKQQYQMINSGAFTDGKDIPASLNRISEEIPYKTSYLDMNMMEYAMVLDLYMRSNIHEPLWVGKDVQEIASMQDKFSLSAHKKIKDGEYPAAIQEFLLAKNIYHWLASDGITPGLNTIYNEFKNEFSSSAYLASLEEEYKEWTAIAAGQIAPEITGVTPDGKIVSLDDLAGKIVYVDVWATWCGPCKEEFPHYQTIQEEFAQNHEVTFLFVSVDKDKEKWINYLIEENIPKGIQILEQENDQHPTIHQSYKIWGIPRYILIDKEGKIVNANAPRPTSGKVVDMIKDLLDKEKPV